MKVEGIQLTNLARNLASKKEDEGEVFCVSNTEAVASAMKGEEKDKINHISKIAKKRNIKIMKV